MTSTSSCRSLHQSIRCSSCTTISRSLTTCSSNLLSKRSTFHFESKQTQISNDSAINFQSTIPHSRPFALSISIRPISSYMTGESHDASYRNIRHNELPFAEEKIDYWGSAEQQQSVPLFKNRPHLNETHVRFQDKFQQNENKQDFDLEENKQDEAPNKSFETSDSIKKNQKIQQYLYNFNQFQSLNQNNNNFNASTSGIRPNHHTHHSKNDDDYETKRLSTPDFDYDDVYTYPPRRLIQLTIEKQTVLQNQYMNQICDYLFYEFLKPNKHCHQLILRYIVLITKQFQLAHTNYQENIKENQSSSSSNENNSNEAPFELTSEWLYEALSALDHYSHDRMIRFFGQFVRLQELQWKSSPNLPSLLPIKSYELIALKFWHRAQYDQLFQLYHLANRQTKHEELHRLSSSSSSRLSIDSSRCLMSCFIGSLVLHPSYTMTAVKLWMSYLSCDQWRSSNDAQAEFGFIFNSVLNAGLYSFAKLIYMEFVQTIESTSDSNQNRIDLRCEYHSWPIVIQAATSLRLIEICNSSEECMTKLHRIERNVLLRAKYEFANSSQASLDQLISSVQTEHLRQRKYSNAAKTYKLSESIPVEPHPLTPITLIGRTKLEQRNYFQQIGIRAFDYLKHQANQSKDKTMKFEQQVDKTNSSQVSNSNYPLSIQLIELLSLHRLRSTPLIWTRDWSDDEISFENLLSIGHSFCTALYGTKIEVYIAIPHVQQLHRLTQKWLKNQIHKQQQQVIKNESNDRKPANSMTQLVEEAIQLLQLFLQLERCVVVASRTIETAEFKFQSNTIEDILTFILIPNSIIKAMNFETANIDKQSDQLLIDSNSEINSISFERRDHISRIIESHLSSLQFLSQLPSENSSFARFRSNLSLFKSHFHSMTNEIYDSHPVELISKPALSNAYYASSQFPTFDQKLMSIWQKLDSQREDINQRNQKNKSKSTDQVDSNLASTESDSQYETHYEAISNFSSSFKLRLMPQVIRHLDSILPIYSLAIANWTSNSSIPTSTKQSNEFRSTISKFDLASNSINSSLWICHRLYFLLKILLNPAIHESTKSYRRFIHYTRMTRAKKIEFYNNELSLDSNASIVVPSSFFKFLSHTNPSNKIQANYLSSITQLHQSIIQQEKLLGEAINSSDESIRDRAIQIAEILLQCEDSDQISISSNPKSKQSIQQYSMSGQPLVRRAFSSSLLRFCAENSIPRLNAATKSEFQYQTGALKEDATTVQIDRLSRLRSKVSNLIPNHSNIETKSKSKQQQQQQRHYNGKFDRIQNNSQINSGQSQLQHVSAKFFHTFSRHSFQSVRYQHQSAIANKSEENEIFNSSTSTHQTLDVHDDESKSSIATKDDSSLVDLVLATQRLSSRFNPRLHIRSQLHLAKNYNRPNSTEIAELSRNQSISILISALSQLNRLDQQDPTLSHRQLPEWNDLHSMLIKLYYSQLQLPHAVLYLWRHAQQCKPNPFVVNLIANFVFVG